MPQKMCMLDPDKPCDGCGECDRCDLDPDKLCDNCMKCLEAGNEQNGYRVVNVGKVVLEGAEYDHWLKQEENTET